MAKDMGVASDGNFSSYLIGKTTDYERPERKKPSLHGRKFTLTPKFLGTAKANFVAQNPCRIQGLITMHPALLVSGAVI